MAAVLGKESESFRYVYSCDLDVNVQIKIGTLEGKREKPSHHALINDPILKFSGLYQESCSDIYVNCQVFSDGKSLALPVRTSYKTFTTRWNWNEWLSLPVKYSELPRNAIVAFTIWDCYGPRKAVPIGGSTMALYGKNGRTFRQGIHDLKVWPNVESDGSLNSTTPGNGDSKDQMSRLSMLTKKHRDGHMLKIDWIDRLTFREIEVINEREKRNSDFMYLMVEFPRTFLDLREYTIVYFEKEIDEIYQFRTYADIVKVPDPEILAENLVESKHHKLARSVRSGLTDKDLKPNAATRDQLNIIVSYPPTKQLTSEEQDLVWKFRFYLSNQKKALTKFLKCVNWNQAGEARQAQDLLHRWTPMDVEDALELLSPAFTHPAVRRYAVDRLKQAPDEDLLLYLLQLVQALKYENFDVIRAGLEPMTKRDSIPTVLPPTPDTPVEGRGQRSGSLQAQTTEVDVGYEPLPSPATPDDVEPVFPPITDDDQCDLATFLISRACTDFTFANYLCWYLRIECEEQDNITKDARNTDMYVTVMKRLSYALMKGGRECCLRRSLLARQQTFVEKLIDLVKTVAREKGDRKKKMERLHALLHDTEHSKMQFTSFEPLPLPLDPDVIVKGIVAEKTSLFKSNLMPCRLTFKTTDNTEYIAIFKHGDDIRQDQLILQIITLMDKLLKRENLDLKLTPYRVLATSNKNGFVQYIDSVTVAEVLSTDGSIQNFFRKNCPSEGGPYGIAHDVMETYVKSCAGYCVVTYLLGVGDRHLDNLLLTRTGRLFHIDFGFILGRDPKPLPPPMKLSKEMVEAMGGINSEHYQEFCKQCYTAFLYLRRHANLILNLFSLMVDANVPDIALEPDKTVMKVQDKFRLDITDEEAVRYLQNLIDYSVTAVVPALVEQIHKIAQYWRR